MAQYKLHKVTSMPATPEANAIYFVKSGSTFSIFVTDIAGVAVAQDIGATNRTLKTVSNTTQYTPIASDYTDSILVFDADTAGADISVILNNVAPSLDGELIIYSISNHVLSFSAGTGITLKATAGNLLKSANDGASMALLGVKPIGALTTLGLYGTLEFTGGFDLPTEYTLNPDSILGIEAEVLKRVKVSDYNIFLQSILNKVTISGISEATILNIAFGGLSLTPEDMLAGSSYTGKITGFIKTPNNTSYYLKFNVGTIQFSKLMPAVDAPAHLPLIVNFNIDFLDGADATRRFFVSGEIQTTSGIDIFDSSGADDILTVDATASKTLNISYQGTEATQEIIVNRITLNRNR